MHNSNIYYLISELAIITLLLPGMDIIISKSKTEYSNLKQRNDELSKYISEITEKLKKYKKSLEITHSENKQLHNKLSDLGKFWCKFEELQTIEPSFTEKKCHEDSSLKEKNIELVKYISEISEQMKQYKNSLEICKSEKLQMHKNITNLGKYEYNT